MALTSNRFQTERYDIQSLALGAPGAGLERMWAVPANRVLQLVAVSCALTTAVAVADRSLFVGMETAGTRCAISGSGRVQVASAGPVGYHFATGVAFADLTAAGVDSVFAPLMEDMFVRTGNSIVISVTNIQGADVLDSIVIRYKEWVQD